MHSVPYISSNRRFGIEIWCTKIWLRVCSQLLPTSLEAIPIQDSSLRIIAIYANWLKNWLTKWKIVKMNIYQICTIMKKHLKWAIMGDIWASMCNREALVQITLQIIQDRKVHYQACRAIDIQRKQVKLFKLLILTKIWRNKKVLLKGKKYRTLPDSRQTLQVTFLQSSAHRSMKILKRILQYLFQTSTDKSIQN